MLAIFALPACVAVVTGCFMRPKSAAVTTVAAGVLAGIWVALDDSKAAFGPTWVLSVPVGAVAGVIALPLVFLGRWFARGSS